MHISSLITDSKNVDSSKLKTPKILRESCDGLTSKQKRIVEGIYKEFLPLIETSLSTELINNLFTKIETQQTATGGNRTMIGKSADVVTKANQIIDNIGKWLQDTAPVQEFDRKFGQLKLTLSQKFPELSEKVENLGLWAKQNPGKTAAIIGVLTALASLAAGPVGGAIAGQVLRGAVELLKGEKLSTAIGKGIKTAALGYLSGKAFQLLGDWIGGFREQSIPFGPSDTGLEKVSWGASKTITAPGMEWTRTTRGFNALVLPEDAEGIRSAMAQIKNGNSSGFDTLYAIATKVNSKDYKDAMSGVVQNAWREAKNNDSILQFINTAKAGLQAASQGAVAASGVAQPKETREISQVSLHESEIIRIFSRIDRMNLSEGVMSALQGVASWANKQAHNITTSITADKLLKIWKKAGSPTDSVEIQRILQFAGVSNDVVRKVFSDLGIKFVPPQADIGTTTSTQATSTQAINTKEIAGKFQKLTQAQQQEIIALLK